MTWTAAAVTCPGVFLVGKALIGDMRPGTVTGPFVDFSQTFCGQGLSCSSLPPRIHFTDNLFLQATSFQGQTYYSLEVPFTNLRGRLQRSTVLPRLRQSAWRNRLGILQDPTNQNIFYFPLSLINGSSSISQPYFSDSSIDFMKYHVLLASGRVGIGFSTVNNSRSMFFHDYMEHFPGFVEFSVQYKNTWRRAVTAMNLATQKLFSLIPEEHWSRALNGESYMTMTAFFNLWGGSRADAELARQLSRWIHRIGDDFEEITPLMNANRLEVFDLRTQSIRSLQRNVESLESFLQSLP